MDDNDFDRLIGRVVVVAGVVAALSVVLMAGVVIFMLGAVMHG